MCKQKILKFQSVDFLKMKAASREAAEEAG